MLNYYILNISEKLRYPAHFCEGPVDYCFFTVIFQPLPELDPTYSTPVRAPPTEMSLDNSDDEDMEETSGQELEVTTVRGKKTKTHRSYFYIIIF